MSGKFGFVVNVLVSGLVCKGLVFLGPEGICSTVSATAVIGRLGSSSYVGCYALLCFTAEAYYYHELSSAYLAA
jgi:hypothetical protein